MSKRIEEVNQVVKKEVAQILLREIEIEPGALATITNVQTSGNIQEAKVFISVFPENKKHEFLKKANSKIYDIQQALNKRLAIRPVPKIKFVIDESEEKRQRIEELLKQ